MPTNTKVAARLITIIRREGPEALRNVPYEFEGAGCWAAANAWLRSQAATFPTHGGCDKHDFSIDFADGERYEGRLDCKAATCPDADLDVGKHVRTFLELLAGVRKPACMTSHEWALALEQNVDVRPTAQRFLDTYDIP